MKDNQKESMQNLEESCQWKDENCPGEIEAFCREHSSTQLAKTTESCSSVSNGGKKKNGTKENGKFGEKPRRKADTERRIHKTFV